MDPVGSLIALLIVIAALAALCGYVTATVRQRNRRPSRGYFVLGVLTGVVGTAIVRRRLGHLSVAGPISRIFTFASDNRFAGAASHVRQTLSRAGITR
ncbi:hypothetical protein BayCH28_26330 [Mycolicibacterium sp. CH28]|uniref:hypothetical protein n=1 Tax=Mycolicibacterium sp. CH28 TaxID=2512237 RepID=UPI0010818102|nr:hypothetical protein [Mycolicibacterium sp. CH28]TGD84291.1 hypothetical protein BayCH28_26330 [Mycolicibacterium sp. CH28]